jgi:hypothetical protein
VPLVGALAILAAVPLAYHLRQRDSLASVMTCNAVDPRGARSPLNYLSCMHHDAALARWEQPPCGEARPKLEAMTAPARLPRTRELLAWRFKDSPEPPLRLRSQAEALALFDACIEEEGFSTAVAIYSRDTSWSRSLAAALLPLLALAWLARARVRIDVDDRAGMVAAVERGWSRGGRVECRIDQVVEVHVEEVPRAGITARRLVLELRSGEWLPLTRRRFAFTGRAHARTAARLREALASARATELSVDAQEG